MSVRRLAAEQPEGFAFTPENLEWAKAQIEKYPEGRQASAVLPLMWRAQEQMGGWLPEPALRYVADMLGMAYIRVYEIATFYTMFNLAPVGRYYVQVCGTTPCWLRGAERDQGHLPQADRRAGPRDARRAVLLDRGRVPRRLRQRAHGADQQGLLRGPDAREPDAHPQGSARPAGKSSPARRMGAKPRRRSAAQSRSIDPELYKNEPPDDDHETRPVPL